jgi:hypothetical protein
MNRAQAIFAGAAAAPLVPALVLGSWTALGLGGPIWLTIPGWSLIFYNFVFIAGVLLGGPLLYLGWRLRMIAWWSTLVSGFLAGALARIGLQASTAFSPEGVLLFGTLGGVAGLVFWLMWRMAKGVQPAARR